MGKNYGESKNRKNGRGPYFSIDHRVMDSPNFIKLSPGALKLLVDIGRQHNGFNNGDLCAAFSVMRKRGWSSAGSLQNAKNELIHFGFIEITQLGSRNRPTLYALTWWPISDIPKKMEICGTHTASNLWKEDREVIKKIRPRKNNICSHQVSTGTHLEDQ